MRALDREDLIVPATWYYMGRQTIGVTAHCNIDSPARTLCVDGRPVLEIHPLEFEHILTETGWTLRVTRKYRRLAER